MQKLSPMCRADSEVGKVPPAKPSRITANIIKKAIALFPYLGIPST